MGERALDRVLPVMLDDSAAEIRHAVRKCCIDPHRNNGLDRGMILDRERLRLTPAQATDLTARLYNVFGHVAGEVTMEDAQTARPHEVLLGCIRRTTLRMTENGTGRYGTATRESSTARGLGPGHRAR
jgi:hypothetical protein